MKLTPEKKEHIDNMSYEQLLNCWRFAPAGDPWFSGETGEYWKGRMNELRKQDEEEHVKASKKIGWEG